MLTGTMSSSTSRKSFGFFPNSALNNSNAQHAAENLSLGELSTEMSTFAHKFEVWMTRINNQMLENRRRFQRDMTEGRERVKDISADIEKTRCDIDRLEVERDKMKTELMNVDEVVQELKQAFKGSVETEEMRLDRELAAMRQRYDELLFEKKKREDVKLERELVTMPQLRKFEEYLGLSMDAVETDLTKFTFKYVDRQNPGREAFFVIDVSTHEYQVVECNFPIDFATALKELNSSRQFFQFVKTMRKLFCEFLNQ